MMTDGDARSALRGGIPLPDAIVTLFSSFMLRLRSALAADFCTPTDDERSAMRGRMPPADAIVPLFLTFVLRLLSAPTAASCTWTEGDETSAMRGGIPPADAIVTMFSAFVLRLNTVPAAYIARDRDLHVAWRQKHGDERWNTACRYNRTNALTAVCCENTYNNGRIRCCFHCPERVHDQRDAARRSHRILELDPPAVVVDAHIMHDNP
jgi:hypothetical protein